MDSHNAEASSSRAHSRSPSSPPSFLSANNPAALKGRSKSLRLSKKGKEPEDDGPSRAGSADASHTRPMSPMGDRHLAGSTRRVRTAPPYSFDGLTPPTAESPHRSPKQHEGYDYFNSFAAESRSHIRRSPRKSPNFLPLLQTVATSGGDDGFMESPIALTKEEKSEMDPHRRADERAAEHEKGFSSGENTPQSPTNQGEGYFDAKWQRDSAGSGSSEYGHYVPGDVGNGSGGGDYTDMGLVDEGDVLPQASDMQQMDVTFDDEGLNTLERIFLLSKSEYPFHRAYVARVLGDLLLEVDPCESVEYVLPLLSGLSMDDDESVREAFAQELHKILWYFYSTCKLTMEEIDPGDYAHEGSAVPERRDLHTSDSDQAIQHWAEEIQGGGLGSGPDSVSAHGSSPIATTSSPSLISQLPASESRKETVTVTSEGVSLVPKPTAEEVAAESIVVVPARQSSLASTSASARPSSGESSSIQATFSSPGGDHLDTPSSTISEETAYSPGILIKPHTEDADDTALIKEQGILVDRPPLQVNFFTPLIGSLLLNHNPSISEAVRTGVIAVLGRLCGHGEILLEVWGHAGLRPEPDERRTFHTQTGIHQHDLRPFTTEEKAMVEHELLQGIVIGMGQLSTDLPEYVPDDPDSGEADPEAFQAQLMHEAVTGRATSVNLIGLACGFYGAEEIADYRFVDEVLRSGDGDVPVRAEAAVAMSHLAKKASVEDVYQMIPLFEEFCQDESDHVKQSACIAVPSLCKRIESPDDRRAFAINALQILTACCEDVRLSALEMLGQVIYIFHDDPRGPPQELLDIYTDDSQVQNAVGDLDWDVIAIFNFPGVCLTLGPERWHEIRSLFHRLESRAGERVLHTMASCLHELAKILNPDQVVQDLLPVYTLLLGETEEIRELVFEHVDVIVASVPMARGWELLQNLASAWKQGTLGGWRARERLASHIPSFLETFSGREGMEGVLEVMRDALLDPFAAVRDAATAGIPKAYEAVDTKGNLDMATRFRAILLDLGASPSFKQRLTFVHCLRQFVKPPPNQDAFENFFLSRISQLACDVVDVRLALAQVISDLFSVNAYYAEVTLRTPETMKEVAKKMQEDESVDVRDTVRNVDLSMAEKGKSTQHEDDREQNDKTPVNDESGPERTGAFASASQPPGAGPSSVSSSSSWAPGAHSSSQYASASSWSSSSLPESTSQEHTPNSSTPSIQIRRPTEDMTAAGTSNGLTVPVPSHGYSYSSEDTNEATPTLPAKEWVGEEKKPDDPFEESFRQITFEPEDV